MKKSLALLTILLMALTLVACSDDTDEPEVTETETEEVTDETEVIEEGISNSDLVGTWGEDGEMRLLLSPDGTGVWIGVFGDIEWEILDGVFYIYLPDDRYGNFEITLEGSSLLLESIMAEDVVFDYMRMSYEVMEIEEHPLLTASTEEIQQAVIDVLNEADKEIFRDVASFGTEQDFIAELLDIDPSAIFPAVGSGEERIISVAIQRLDRFGNDVNRRYTSEDVFSHWDFVYEFREDDTLRLIMRHHFDIEADMSGVTRENFDAIENGMSLDDVSSLLGSEGTLGVTSGNHEIRTWSREFGGGTTVIISIYFVDDQVSSKAQVGW